MQVIRPVTEADEAGLQALSELNWQGLTILPGSSIAWRQKIAQSLTTFARNPPHAPQLDDLYLFVLEDLALKRLVGTCQIVGRTAGSSTLGYYYHLETLALPAQTVDILQPVRREATTTELGGLFLDPTVRKQGLSALASLSRLLFIAEHPDRFCPQLIAEIRGCIDESGNSPFWNALGRHFWDITYAELMQRLSQHPPLVTSLLSPFPVYRFLLDPTLQTQIGQAHPLSQIALNRLIDQGFQPTGDVDPFDAGPKIMAETKQLRTIREHQQLTLTHIEALPKATTQALIANNSLQFRACMTSVKILDKTSVAIDQETASALGLALGDSVRLLIIERHT